MTANDLIAAFETLAEAPDGVKRLRELVLQLAVRGKLVPQDAGDEPASKLIERASQFNPKARSAGKTLISVDAPYVSPPGWVWTTATALGDTSPRNKVEDDAVVGFVPMAVVPKEYGASLSPELRTWAEIKKGFTHIADGDIAVAKITPCFQNGKACVVSGLPFGVGAGTTELLVLRPHPKTLDARYALAFFKSPDFVRGGVETFTGTAGQQRVSNDYFRSRPFPLPPLAEQHRIVARVDELMSLLDRLEAARATRDELRRAARDAALAALRMAEDTEAVEAAWGRIAEQMGALFAQPEDVAPLRQAVLELGCNGGLSPKEKTGWRTMQLHQLLREPLANGRSVPDGAGFPVLRLTALRGKVVDTKHQKLGAWTEEEGSRFQIEAGDLLVVRGNGSRDIVARASRVLTSEKVAYPDTAIRVRTKPEQVETAYLHYAWHSFGVRIQLETRARTTNGIWKVSQGDLEAVELAIPPLAEQHRIVAKVDALMALCDTLEARLTTARDLHAAFAAAAVHHLDV